MENFDRRTNYVTVEVETENGEKSLQADGYYYYPNNTDGCLGEYKRAYFPKGKKGLEKFIAKNLDYPQKAIDNKEEGIVVVEFKISDYGIVFDPRIIESVSDSCDNAALKVVNKLPNFVPASCDGENIESSFIVNIEFKLEENE